MKRFIISIQRVYCSQELLSWYLQKFGSEYQELHHIVSRSWTISIQWIVDGLWKKPLWICSPRVFWRKLLLCLRPKQRYFYLVGYFLENLQILKNSFEHFDFAEKKNASVMTISWIAILGSSISLNSSTTIGISRKKNLNKIPIFLKKTNNAMKVMPSIRTKAYSFAKVA